MNAKEYKEILTYRLGLSDIHIAEAKGYLAALEGEEVKALVKALKKIDNQKMCDLSDDMIERTMQLSGLWASLKFIAHEALTQYRKSIGKEEEK